MDANNLYFLCTSRYQDQTPETSFSHRLQQPQCDDEDTTIFTI